jgi:hypothetical protein
MMTIQKYRLFFLLLTQNYQEYTVVKADHDLWDEFLSAAPICVAISIEYLVRPRQ